MPSSPPPSCRSPKTKRGYTELYRYDASTESLHCVSCTATGAAAAADASLASDGLSLTEDGRVFFNPPTLSARAADTDDKQDVYEWESQGTGNCQSSKPVLRQGRG